MSAKLDLVIKGGIVVNADHMQRADIGISAGRVVALGEALGDAKQTIDATGRLVMPGGVDTHCHIEQVSGNGLLNADTFETATRSAAFGGNTTVVSHAAQHKGNRMATVVKDYSALAARGAMVDYAFHIIVSDPEVEALEADIASLAGDGHRSLKIFTTYAIRLSDAQILKVLALARKVGALVCIHAENHDMIQHAVQRNLAAGNVAPKFHAQSHIRLAEAEAVSRMIRFSEFLDQPIMLFHISTREGVEAVREARARGARVSAETCTHYLLMTTDVLDRPGIEGAKFMCSPPQREVADQEALWEGLTRGDLQIVTSDHAPFRFDETGKLNKGKAPAFNEIPNGMPGLEVRLPLLFDAMVSQGHFDACRFVQITSSRPAQIFGLRDKGRIAVGADGDIAIWNPTRQVKYEDNDLHDNVGYNPYAGRTVTGWPEIVISRGQPIIADGELLAYPGRGQRVRMYLG